jgi:hypothetical protein
MIRKQIQSTNVGSQSIVFRLGFLSTVFLAAAPMAQATVVFSDGTFNLADWNTTKYYWGNGGAITLSQIATGGNPGKFLEIDHYVQPASADPSVVFGLHLRDGATYNPSVQGEITSIDLSVNFENLYTTAAGMAFGFTLKQDGKVYNNFRSLSGTTTGWQLDMHLGLQESSFGLWTPGADNFSADFSQNPDFSTTGSSIEFGLFTYNGHTESDNPSIKNVGFDNWTVAIVPEPTTFAITALGGLLLKKRRKSA